MAKAPTKGLSTLNSMAFGLAVYASQGRLPDTTQDSLPAAGQALLDGVFTRKVPMKGFKVEFHIFLSPFPKLAWRNRCNRLHEYRRRLVQLEADCGPFAVFRVRRPDKGLRLLVKQWECPTWLKAKQQTVVFRNIPTTTTISDTTSSGSTAIPPSLIPKDSLRPNDGAACIADSAGRRYEIRLTSCFRRYGRGLVTFWRSWN